MWQPRKPTMSTTTPDRLPKRASKPADPFTTSPKVRRPEREADYRAALQNDPRVSRNATATGSALIFRYWQSMELYASQGTMAEVAKYGPTNRAAVRRDLKELVDLGYLEHVKTLPDRR